MKIYIAGPMRGKHRLNFDAFTEVEGDLGMLGHETFNPCRLHASYEEAVEAFKDPNEGRRALKAELSWICDNADGIYMLKGWEKSLGSRAEHALAVVLELKIFYQGPL